MCLQGASTRGVTKVMGELYGLDVTSTEVSPATAALNEMFEAWRTKPMDDEITSPMTEAVESLQNN